MTENIVPNTAQPAGSTRREILNYAWLASLGLLTIQIAGISVYLSLPRFGRGEFGGIITVGPLSELPDTDSPPLNNPEGKFWLVRTEQGLITLYKVCPHLDCLVLWDDQEGRFVCPCHGSQFDRNGAYLSGPAPRNMDRFVVQFVAADGSILVETDATTGAPLPIPEPPVLVEAGNASPASTHEETIVQVDTGQRLPGSPASA